MVRNPSPPPPINLYGTLRQPRKLIFGMQPYFDPTRKTTSQKNDLKKMKKRRRPKQNEMEDDLNFKSFLLSLFNNKNLKNKWF
jgi:hypothetical protein